MDNKESQENEICALESIYESSNQFFCDGMCPPKGRFLAEIKLDKSISLVYNDRKNVDAELLKSSTSEIFYLPPITLTFELPPSYPDLSCPAFTLSCMWLSFHELTVLCRHLEKIWEEIQDVCLFNWFQFLQQDALELLKIRECLDISELMNYRFNADALSDGHVLKSVNIDNSTDSKVALSHIKPICMGGDGEIDNRSVTQLFGNVNLFDYLVEENFNNTEQTCEVCFESKYGANFLAFRPCKHIFCKGCLKSFFEIQIETGNITAMNCPNTKCDSQADGTLIKEVVEEEVFAKFDRLALSRCLEGMSDIAYCPRNDCQKPVIIDRDLRMGNCSSCGYTFCILCKMTYHALEPCSMKAAGKTRIFEEYINGTETTRKEIEKRYGKKHVKYLVEESLSEGWKNSNSKPCPHCMTNIERSEGCHKMTCFKCNTFFCWVCGIKLNGSKPYLHYQDMRSPCYNNLFPADFFEEGDEMFEFL